MSTEEQRFITYKDLPAIKDGYEKALEAGEENFTIINSDGLKCEFYIKYAKYLIEYLESLAREQR